MNQGMAGVLAIVAVYGAAQMTISPMMRSRIDEFSAELAKADKGTGETVGPIAISSSDICTLLTEPDSLWGTLERWSFLDAGEAADALAQKYTFTPVSKCDKYQRFNALLAHPKAS